MANFSSSEYAWNDITVIIGGRPITGIRAIKYKVERKVNHIYAKGKKPHSRTKGNKTFTGEIELLQSEVIALELQAGKGKDITDLTFDIVVCYSPELGGNITTDIVKNVDVTGYEKGMKQNDDNMTITLPFMAGDVLNAV